MRKYNYLAHHGILGMKWGKRNGPPYPLSPGDHSQSEKKAGWRKSLNKVSDSYKKSVKQYYNTREKDIYRLDKKEYYKEYGSRQTADKKRYEKYGTLNKWNTLTDKQKKVIIGIAAGAGVTIGAALLYRNVGRYYIDSVIKTGTTLQTLSFDKNRVELGEHFYASYLKGDTSTYLSRFHGSNILKPDFTPGEIKSKIKTGVIEDIKVASPKTISKELKNFINNNKSNPEIKDHIYKYFSNHLSSNVTGVTRFKDSMEMNVKDWQGLANEYIRDLNFQYEDSFRYNPDNMPFVKEFYKHLSSKGYGAIKDYNDMGWTTAPVIIFDKAKLGESVVSGITFDDFKNAKNTQLARDLIAAYSDQPITSVIYGSAAAGSVAAISAEEYNAHKRNSKGV